MEAEKKKKKQIGHHCKNMTARSRAVLTTSNKATPCWQIKPTQNKQQPYTQSKQKCIITSYISRSIKTTHKQAYVQGCTPMHTDIKSPATRELPLQTVTPRQMVSGKHKARRPRLSRQLTGLSGRTTEFVLLETFSEQCVAEILVFKGKLRVHFSADERRQL